jgi:hypothetical protein
MGAAYFSRFRLIGSYSLPEQVRQDEAYRSIPGFKEFLQRFKQAMILRRRTVSDTHLESTNL